MFPIRDHNPSARTPFVTWALILLNVAIFVGYAGALDDPRALASVYGEYAMIPERVAAGRQTYTVLTSMFLHGGWMHLIGNMLFLYIFGDNIEDVLGHVGFLAFYLATGVAAALAHLAADPSSGIPTVGASGAIAGVMGGYLLLFPRARVDVLFIFIIIVRIIPLPAWTMLGLWFALQIFNGGRGRCEPRRRRLLGPCGGLRRRRAGDLALVAEARRPALLAPHPRAPAAPPGALRPQLGPLGAEAARLARVAHAIEQGAQLSHHVALRRDGEAGEEADREGEHDQRIGRGRDAPTRRPGRDPTGQRAREGSEP